MSQFEAGHEVKRSRFEDAPPRKLKIKKKVYPSVAQYPTVDFRALLEPEREHIEHETRAVLSMRGKGSGHEEDKEMLHVLIEAETEEQAHKAERLVRDLLNDPSKLPAPVQTQLVLRQSIFGPRPTKDFQQNRAGEFYKEVRVPESVAGGIIGRAGETVKRLQGETNTRIHINRDETSASADGFRVIVVRGSTQESVDACEKLILEIAASRQSGNNSTGGGDYHRVVAASAAPTSQPSQTQYSSTHPTGRSHSTSPPAAIRGPGAGDSLNNRNGQVTENHVVPNRRAGAVIGRGGATIKALQARYRASITVPPAPDPQNPNERTISIAADSSATIALIKQEIDAIVEGKASYLANQDDVGTPVKIPDDKAGLVIGKQGATIKAIQDRLQVRIQIPSQADDVRDVIPMRTAMVVGRPEHVRMAIAEIEAIVNGDIYAGDVTGSSGVSAATAGGQQQQDYAKQWEEYYKQLAQLPPDQQKLAIEALAEHQKSLGLM